MARGSKRNPQSEYDLVGLGKGPYIKFTRGLKKGAKPSNKPIFKHIRVAPDQEIRDRRGNRS